MLGKINVITINISDNDPQYIAYKTLTVPKKIAVIASTIQEVIIKLEQREPESMNIVVWREYGIHDITRKIISIEMKNLLKEVMQELCTKHHSLVIIAGTVASEKEYTQFTPQNYLDTYNEYYKLRFQIDIKDSVINDHLQKILMLQNSKYQHIRVVRNSTFIFKNSHFLRYDKIAPFHETIDRDDDIPNAIYKPGKDSTRKPSFTVTHPFTQEELCLGIEICYEHDFGALKEYIKLHHLNKPDLHFLLSDSITYVPGSVCADRFIHVDSVNPPSLYLSGDATEPCGITLYAINVLSTPDIENPLISTWLFERDVMLTIENHLPKMKDETFKKSMLFLRDQLSNTELTKLNFLNVIKNWLHDQTEFLGSHKSFFSFFSLFSMPEQERIICEAFLAKLKELIDKETAMDVDVKIYDGP